MASQSAALQLILQAINAMREPATPRSSPPTPGSTSRAAPLAPTPSATAPSAAASSSAGQPTSGASWLANPARAVASPGDGSHGSNRGHLHPGTEDVPLDAGGPPTRRPVGHPPQQDGPGHRRDWPVLRPS